MCPFFEFRATPSDASRQLPLRGSQWVQAVRLVETVREKSSKFGSLYVSPRASLTEGPLAVEGVALPNVSRETAESRDSKFPDRVSIQPRVTATAFR